jgi:glycosyltransferase involved in cell wall biosynthesis
MNIAILNTHVPFCSGGAEILAEDLQVNLERLGHRVDTIRVPFKWYPQESLVDSMLSCRLLDIDSFNDVNVDLVIALKFPAWLIPHDNKIFWVLHQHRSAYELWDSGYSELRSMPDGATVRELIQHADQQAMSDARAIFTISETVTTRLQDHNGIDSSVIYPPPRRMDSLHCRDYGDFLLCPSRVTAMKRQDLLIEALAKTRCPVRIRFAGRPDNDDYLSLLQSKARTLGVDERIEWLGHVSDEELRSLYADCLAVAFVPFLEDYGYVTPESMLSSKAVISCRDAGGAIEFIDNGSSGLVCEPSAESLAVAMDQVWDDRAATARMGENARQAVVEQRLDWDAALERMLAGQG